VTIVVTGASRGIGRAICERLVLGGTDVVGIARNGGENDSFPIMQCDVADAPALRALARRLKQEGKSIKGLINAAGIALMNLAVSTPPETAERIIGTNLLGTIYACQAFSPSMIRAGGGVILNFSTIAVALGLKGESVYVASKAGVEAFSRVFAREMAAFAITVNCIAPGPIATDLLNGVGERQIEEIVSQQIIARRFDAGSVCDLVEILLDPRSRSLSGQVFHVGGV
jgi:3-oxoacyl-[acyl-carrier protein] reductase